MSRFARQLDAGHFVVTAEIDPPRGTGIVQVMRKIAALDGWIDAVNITDSPRANMRMSPIALAHMVGEQFGMETVFHLTCRDRNMIGLQSELLGAAALGVRNILALSGDAPAPAGDGGHRGVYEVDSLGLVSVAAALNRGFDDTGRKLNGTTSFCIGVGANPHAPDLGREADRVLAKVARGAHFIQTQPVYDVDTFLRLAEHLEPARVPVLAGLLVPRTVEQLVQVIAAIPGVHVPGWFISAAEEGGMPAVLSLLARTAGDLATAASGIHIMPMGSVESAHAIASAVGRTGCAGREGRTANEHALLREALGERE